MRIYAGEMRLNNKREKADIKTVPSFDFVIKISVFFFFSTL